VFLAGGEEVEVVLGELFSCFVRKVYQQEAFQEYSKAGLFSTYLAATH
jgi:hypothetical protein